MPSDICIIIVNRSTAEATLACLDTIRDNTSRRPARVVVADIETWQGDASRLEQHAGAETVLRLPAGTSYTCAVNRASGTAKNSYLLLLHPTVHLNAGAIDQIASIACCTSHAGLWLAQRVVAPPASGASIGDYTGRNHAEIILAPDFECGLYATKKNSTRDKIENHECTPFVSPSKMLLVHPDVWRLTGGFDETFRQHGAAEDLCRRASHLGATPLLVPVPSLTTRRQASDMPTDIAPVIDELAGTMTYLRKHHPPLQRWLRRLSVAGAPAWQYLRALIQGATGSCDQVQAIAAHDRWKSVLQQADRWWSGYQPPRAARSWQNSKATNHNPATARNLPASI